MRVEFLVCVVVIGVLLIIQYYVIPSKVVARIACRNAGLKPTYAAVIVARRRNPDLLAWTWIAGAQSVDVLVIVHNEEPPDGQVWHKTTTADGLHYVLVSTSATRAHGFRNTLWTPTPIIVGDVCAWDKALFFLSTQTEYTFTWIIEDDVLIPSAFAFTRLHERAVRLKYDVVIASHTSYIESVFWPHWYVQTMHLPTPWFKSMSCAVGLSRAMLCQVHLYAEKYGTLAFHELFFTSLAQTYQMLVHTPRELRTVVWHHQYSCADIAAMPYNWFHPVKKNFSQFQCQ